MLLLVLPGFERARKTAGQRKKTSWVASKPMTKKEDAMMSHFGTNPKNEGQLVLGKNELRQLVQGKAWLTYGEKNTVDSQTLAQCPPNDASVLGYE